MSARTADYYRQAATQFCRWMVRKKRAATNPLDGVEVDTNNGEQRRERRAFTEDELTALFNTLAKRDAATRFGMTAAQRSMLYRTALETVLRSSELRSVRRSDLALSDERSDGQDGLG